MLENKAIIVTGALGLIGQCFCKTLLDQGAHVIAGDISDARLETLKSELAPEKAENLAYLSLDITSTESVKNFYAAALKIRGRIDGLVNNAYPRNRNYGKTFFNVSYEDFCENIGMNLGGYFLMCKELAAAAKEVKFQANIVNIASIYGVIAPRFDIYEGTEMTMPVEYAAIKSGVIHLTKYMAKFLKPFGIRVNSLSPGGIYDQQPESFVENYRKYCTSKGMLSPDDLCGALLFLLSDQSMYVNGQNIIVDDGFVL